MPPWREVERVVGLVSAGLPMQLLLMLQNSKVIPWYSYYE
jgi:hypothetical protein